MQLFPSCLNQITSPLRESNRRFDKGKAISKRANQISAETKEELTQKLQEFATSTDNLEEIFENREQIEISKHYEKMPKATAVATQELLEDKIYMRKPEEK